MNHQRLPAKTRFMGLRSVKTDETPEAKSVWVDRIMFLLSAKISDSALKDVEAFQDILEDFSMFKGATFADIMHLQQVMRAMRGDTKAYLAIQKTVSSAVEQEKASNVKDPMEVLSELLYGAMAKAGLDTSEGHEGPIIIDAEVVEK